LFTLGCLPGEKKNYPVKGRVVAPQKEIIGSYLLTRTVDLHEDYKPISDARVYLAYDEDGKKPVVGYEARSDKTGSYEIDTKDIPPAQSEYNRYFLIVEKRGYEPIKQRMGLGFMSSHLNNTAVLMPLKKEEADKC